MARLNERALRRQDEIAAGRGLFSDDEPFLLAHAQARIWQLDTELLSRTRRAHPILKANGTTEVAIARSLRVAGVTASGGGEPGRQRRSTRHSTRAR